MHTKFRQCTVRGRWIAPLVCIIVVAAGWRGAQGASPYDECVGLPYPADGCPTLYEEKLSESRKALCGNGIVDPGEECDMGRFNGLTYCTQHCTIAYCGDGYIAPYLGEECEPESRLYYARDPKTGHLVTEKRFVVYSCGTYCMPPECDEGGVCSGGCRYVFAEPCKEEEEPAAFFVLQDESGEDVLVPLTEEVADVNGEAEEAVPAAKEETKGVVDTQESTVSTEEQKSTEAAVVVPAEETEVMAEDEEEEAEVADEEEEMHEAPPDEVDDVPAEVAPEPATVETVQAEVIIETAQEANVHEAAEEIEATEDMEAIEEIEEEEAVEPICGNGILEEGEECDDGTRNSDTHPDACRTDCRLPYCGDGVVDAGEECDGGEYCTDECTRQTLLGIALSSGRITAALIAFVTVVGGTAAYVLIRAVRKKKPKPVAKTQVPSEGGSGMFAFLDNVPLTELELPWHKWGGGKKS